MCVHINGFSHLKNSIKKVVLSDCFSYLWFSKGSCQIRGHLDGKNYTSCQAFQWQKRRACQSHSFMNHSIPVHMPLPVYRRLHFFFFGLNHSLFSDSLRKKRNPPSERVLHFFFFSDLMVWGSTESVVFCLD